jgi:hypothetical protein
MVVSEGSHALERGGSMFIRFPVSYLIIQCRQRHAQRSAPWTLRDAHVAVNKAWERDKILGSTFRDTAQKWPSWLFPVCIELAQ